MYDGKHYCHVCPVCGSPHSNGKLRYCSGCSAYGTALDLCVLLGSALFAAGIAIALSYLLY